MGRLDSPIQLVFVITAQPVDALNAIKGRFHIKDWISDPCYLIPWEGIGCHRIGDFDSDIRISEIGLSGRKLTGSVPDDIEQLTALLTLSLDNNYFTGPMSNFTSLTMLERLNIANNNFSGVIPAKLFVNCSLKLIYSGNPYLRMGKRECILHNLGKNYKNKIGFKVAIEIGGLIALAVLVISLLSIGYLFDRGQRRVYKGPSAENSELNWKRRLKITLDAAQGLEYFHVGCTPKIIHRDIKSDNILLNTNLNGKLADFGLSRMTMGEATHVTTGVKGTFGYLDPEYYNTQMLTEKSDMYSFGVNLLEIICGRPPIDLKLAEEKINIVRWVTPYLLEMDENGGEIIDKRLCGGYDIKSITGVAKVAMRCVQAVPSSRPSVGEVVAELKEAIKHDDKDSISIAEDIGIQNGDLVAVMADSNKREGMEWSDNSSNISKVGR